MFLSVTIYINVHVIMFYHVVLLSWYLCCLLYVAGEANVLREYQLTDVNFILC